MNFVRAGSRHLRHCARAAVRMSWGMAQHRLTGHPPHWARVHVDHERARVSEVQCPGVSIESIRRCGVLWAPVVPSLCTFLCDFCFHAISRCGDVLQWGRTATQGGTRTATLHVRFRCPAQVLPSPGLPCRWSGRLEASVAQHRLARPCRSGHPAARTFVVGAATPTSGAGQARAAAVWSPWQPPN